ncbi:MAG: hypothetical protein Q8S31_08745 [Alphaproteobacteria bacterium]|nr:hypothetical protein [Alphaproteobacteria bacterium]
MKKFFFLCLCFFSIETLLLLPKAYAEIIELKYGIKVEPSSPMTEGAIKVDLEEVKTFNDLRKKVSALHNVNLDNHGILFAGSFKPPYKNLKDSGVVNNDTIGFFIHSEYQKMHWAQQFQTQIDKKKSNPK